MPTMRSFLRKGAYASGSGLLTQAPPNTGAGWYTLATGAWPGVHGSTNNTFHKSGAAVRPTGPRPSTPGVLQAETIAQSAERAWPQGRPGRVGGWPQRHDQRPDDRLPVLPLRPRRRDQLHRHEFGDPLFDDVAVHHRPSASSSTIRPATPGRRPFPGAAPTDATGWTGRPDLVQPGQGDAPARARLRRRQVRPQRLHLRRDRTTATVDYDRVLFSASKNGAERGRHAQAGQWADVKVKIVGGALDGQDRRHAGQGRGADQGPLARPPVPHVGVARHRDVADLARRAAASPATSRSTSPRRSRPRPRPTSPSSRPASSARTPTSSRACTGRPATVPMLKYVVEDVQAGPPARRHADDRRVPAPVPRTGHEDAAERCRQPVLRRRRSRRRPRRPRPRARGATSGRAYQEADETLTLARKLIGKDPTTFVASDHGFAPQFLAIDASKVAGGPEAALDAADLELPSRHGRDHRQGQGLLGRRHGPDLPERRPGATRPAAASSRSSRPTQPRRSRRSRPRTSRSPIPNDWTHDGNPEGWKMIDRVFTRAESRYIPNGPGTTADMAHPDADGRPRRLLLPALPVRRRDAGHARGALALLRPARLRAGRPGPRQQHQHAGDLPRRWQGHRPRPVKARSIDLAPTLAYMLGIPEPQHSQGRVLLDVVKGTDGVKPISIIGLNDFHGQLSATTTTIDGLTIPVGGAAELATLFDEESQRLPPHGLILAGGDNVGASPPNSALLEDDAGDRRRERLGPGRHVLRQPRVRLRDPAAADPPGTRQLPVPRHQHRRDRDRPAAVVGHAPRRSSTSTASRSASSAPSSRTTPELVSAGATAGLTFLPEEGRIQAEFGAPAQAGREGPGLVIHEGSILGSNALGNTPGTAWSGPIIDIAEPPGHDASTRWSSATRTGSRTSWSATSSSPRASTPARRTRSSSSWSRAATSSGPVARRASPRPSASRRAPTSRRSSTPPTPRSPRSCNQVVGTQANDITRDPDRKALRVRDGEHGRRRDAGEVPRGRGRLDQLRRPPGGLPVRRSSSATEGDGRSPPARCSRAAVRQRDRHRDPDRRAGQGRRSSTASRPSATSAHQYRPVPAGLGTGRHVPLQRHDAGRRRHLEGPRTGRPARRPRSPTATRSGSSPTTSCTPVATGTPIFIAGHERAVHGRPDARRGDPPTSRRTRTSTRSSRDGSP